jgi:hypothetical protein
MYLMVPPYLLTVEGDVVVGAGLVVAGTVVTAEVAGLVVAAGVVEAAIVAAGLVATGVVEVELEHPVMTIALISTIASGTSSFFIFPSPFLLA